MVEQHFEDWSPKTLFSLSKIRTHQRAQIAESVIETDTSSQGVEGMGAMVWGGGAAGAGRDGRWAGAR